ncbi:Type III-B CRISPR module RAMP protein Cmr4 [Candidatus Electrothrix laxa]
MKKNAILGLLAQTSIHAGTGHNTGIIDLPIQREGHNGWPCVFGSAVKGALRSHAEQSKAGERKYTKEEYVKEVKQADEIVAVYGPPQSESSEHAGAVLVTDARLLFLPVRSLTSQFKWVTCPYALKKYKQTCAMLGISGVDFPVPGVPEHDERTSAIVDDKATKQEVFLEEYRFEVEQQDLTKLITALASLMRKGKESSSLENALRKQLIIVSNDDFTYLAQHATPVNAHIALDSATKTVLNGALWYEETLPPETLLYCGLSAHAARNGGEFNADQVLQFVLRLFQEKPWLQLGGNETVGMGWCAVSDIQSIPAEEG